VSLLKRWGMSATVVCLLAAAALALFVPWLTRLRWALMIAAGVLFIATAAANWREGASLLGRRGTRYGASAVLLIVLALGIVVMANAVSVRYSARWDLTENKRHSLSSQTVKILQGLKAPVEAIAFFRSDQPGKRVAEDLLKQYAQASKGKLTYRMDDPDRSPGLAKRLGVESYGTLVLQSGEKSEKVLEADEERLTNALVKVTRSGKRVVYLLKGHGEREIGNTERAGLSRAKDELEKANYELKDLVLARDPQVPADASVVIIAGPRTDLFPQELEAIDAYLTKGGKVFFMADPFQAEGLAKYLTKYGITLGNDVVIELNPIGRLFGVGPEVPVINQYEQHPITKDLAGVMTLFPITRSVQLSKAQVRGVAPQVLARSSQQSWGETDRAGLQRGEVKPDANDTPGPVPVAAVVTLDVLPGAGTKGEGGKGEDKTPSKARIVVVGTSNLASNQFLGAQGNRDFFMNVVSWLADEADQVAVRPRDARQQPIFINEAQSQAVLWLSLLVLPGAVMVCGILVVVRRRRQT
jgi:gliding motility-associatede transport system auxiliary component